MKTFFTLLATLATIVSQAQFAGAVDTTFAPNATTNGYHKAVAVEIVGDNVYYAYSTPSGQPVIRKYDFQGNEDESWYTNQMTTWGTQFATFTMEPERSLDGSYTGKFFVCGRNSSNYLVNQGVRFLNKINADGTRDLNFVCPTTSWISICSTVYHDWENNKLYYAYQSGMPSNYMQTIVCCDPNTGQTLQTIMLPQSTGQIRKFAKIPGTNDLIVGGELNFTLNGNQYHGMFKLNSSFTIAPIQGVTNLASNMSIADILFVDDADCSGTPTGVLKAYVAGSGNLASGVSGLRSIARYTLGGDTWSIDTDYNAGCSGTVGDIAYYNCHLIAVGNFASSMSSGPYAPTWTPKVTAFTSDGMVSDEFKMINIGSGLGGVHVQGFEDNFGQGTAVCLAVNPVNDGNDRWEIFVGGTFCNLIQGPMQPRSVVKPMNYVAKLYGFGTTIDSRFTYCLDYNNETTFSISTFGMVATSGCEKWELFQGDDNLSWSLIRTETAHIFSDSTLAGSVWYKLTRTVTECGNTCSSSFIIYNDMQNCQTQNNGVELRSLVVTEDDNEEMKQQEVEGVGLIVSPNPATNVINISDTFGDIYKNVELFNALGARVTSAMVNSKTYQLDIANLASGLYMLVVTTDEGVKRQQIIKE